MSQKTIRTVLDVSSAQSEQQKIVFRMANVCAGLARAAGCQLPRLTPGQLIAKTDDIQRGTLLAVLEMCDALALSDEGKKALLDLGFDCEGSQI